jgi:hypothetical protein
VSEEFTLQAQRVVPPFTTTPARLPADCSCDSLATSSFRSAANDQDVLRVGPTDYQVVTRCI